MKDLLHKLEEEEEKVEALKKKRKCPCFSFTTFTLLSSIIVLIINNIGKILLTIPYFKALFKVNEEHITNIFSVGVYVEEGIRSKIHGFLIHFI